MANIVDVPILPDDTAFLILMHLPLLEKVRLYDQMRDWRRITRRALLAQRIVSNSELDEDEFPHEQVDDRHMIPWSWTEAAKLSNFKRLLKLCPNLTSVHIVIVPSQDVSRVRLLNAIFSSQKALTTLTFYITTCNEKTRKKIVDFCRDRKGKLEYIGCPTLGNSHANQIMSASPNLKGIDAENMVIDFANGGIDCSRHTINRLTKTRTLTDFSVYLRGINSNYKKLYSKGIIYKKITMLDIDVSLYNEVSREFVQLEYLHLHVDEEILDLRQLKSLTNLRHLHLQGRGTLRVSRPPKYMKDEIIPRNTEDDIHWVPEGCINSSKAIENIAVALSQMNKLEVLELMTVFVSDRSLKFINELCPSLRQVHIEFYDELSPIITEKSINSILKLKLLDKFYCVVPNYVRPIYCRNSGEVKDIRLNLFRPKQLIVSLCRLNHL